jgi:enolase
MPIITSITSNKFLNSRGDWTIHSTVTLDDGSVGTQAVPEGASKGLKEVVCFPPDKAARVVSGPINLSLVGKNALDQKGIDSLLLQLDGTPAKKKLGGNSILSVSLAVAQAAAKSKKVQLYEYLRGIYGNTEPLKFPTPVFNIINGGKHASNDLSFQEFMVIPAQYTPFDRAVEMGRDIYLNLKKDLEKEGADVDVGDEGGFAPDGLTSSKALEFMRKALGRKYKPGHDVFFGIDIAAGSFYDKGKYNILEENLSFDGGNLSSYYANLLRSFEIIYIEDPFYEEDTKSWEQFFMDFGSKAMVVADDLVVTNPKLLQETIRSKRANAVIVKPNQIGTLTETLDFVRIAKNAGMAVIVSHRSGDTPEDTFIADLALGVGANFIKSGAPARGERVAKYNRLLEIFYKTGAKSQGT